MLRGEVCLAGSALLEVEEGTPRMARGGLEEERRAVLYLYLVLRERDQSN